MALFWLSDEAWAAIEPHLPKNQPGARRVDDRRVISGILHVLKVGCRWCDCPANYGPSTTIYNRFNRWSRRGFWLKLLTALVDAGVVTKSTAIDSTYIKIQRAAFGAKGGARRKQSGVRAAAGPHIKAAPALLERAGRMRYLLGDKPVLSLSKGATTPTACAVPYALQVPRPSFRGAATGSGPSATTSSDTAGATSSRTPSAD
jgi:transposase